MDKDRMVQVPEVDHQRPHCPGLTVAMVVLVPLVSSVVEVEVTAIVLNQVCLEV